MYMFIAEARNNVLIAEGDCVVGHGIHDGEGLYPYALGPECVAAALEALLNGDSRTHHGAA
mgnify:CR=1 FL=1